MEVYVLMNYIVHWVEWLACNISVLIRNNVAVISVLYIDNNNVTIIKAINDLAITRNIINSFAHDILQLILFNHCDNHIKHLKTRIWFAEKGMKAFTTYRYWNHYSYLCTGSRHYLGNQSVTICMSWSYSKMSSTSK